jgi:hypothetical protein
MLKKLVTMFADDYARSQVKKLYCTYIDDLGVLARDYQAGELKSPQVMKVVFILSLIKREMKTIDIDKLAEETVPNALKTLKDLDDDERLQEFLKTLEE